jgi:hypothetical protein
MSPFYFIFVIVFFGTLGWRAGAYLASGEREKFFSMALVIMFLIIFQSILLSLFA